MITLHVKLENEYFKLNDYIEDGNITWGKNGDDGVSVTLKNVPNGKNLLADSLGRELVAYRDGELAWKGFVSNVTENENGIELVGRGDFHKLDYIEDFGKFYIQNTYENWGAANPSNTPYYPDLTVTSGAFIWLRAEDVYKGTTYKWYDARQNGIQFTNDIGSTAIPTTWDAPVCGERDKLPVLGFRNITDSFPNIQTSTLMTTSTTYPSSTGHEFYLVFDALDTTFNTLYQPFGTLLKYGPFELSIIADYTSSPYQYAKIQLVIRTTGSPHTADLGFPDRIVNRTILRIKVLADNQTVEVYKDFQLLTTINLTNPIDLTNNEIYFGNKIGSSIFDTLTLCNVYEFVSYSGNLNSTNVDLVNKYFNEKYKLLQYNPSNFESVIVPYNVNVSETSPIFEGQVYMSLQNGDTFSLNDAYLSYFKVPESSESGANTAFFNIEYLLPSGFTLDLNYYNNDLEVNQIYSDRSVLNSGTVQKVTRTVNFDSANDIRQINFSLVYAPYSSRLSPLTYTNTASNDYYYIKLSNFVASNLRLNQSRFYRLSEDSVDLGNGRFLYTTLKNDLIRLGSIIGLGTVSVAGVVAYVYVESVKTVVKSSVEYTEFICSNAISRVINTMFYIFEVSSADVVNDIYNNYFSDSNVVVENQGDILLNSVYQSENLKQSVQNIADSLNCKAYKQGSTTFFIRNPINTYYLNQSSKSISQSFDKFYNRVRSNYKSIYELDNYTSYIEKPSKITIKKSKTVKLGTSAAGLASEIIDRVADEDIASVVKVIPQTGELYNEYGAVVRDPKINSAVVLKNVVPELIGLGDKTYYLSEITYNFATGEYEYVIDEPELTFELILSRTQNL